MMQSNVCVFVKAVVVSLDFSMSAVVCDLKYYILLTVFHFSLTSSPSLPTTDYGPQRNVRRTARHVELGGRNMQTSRSE